MTAGAPLLRRWSCAAVRARCNAPTGNPLQGFARRSVAAARSLLPQSCALCRAPSGAALLCPPCASALPSIGVACPCCALPAAHAGRCTHCHRRPPPWSRAIAAWTYAFPVDRLVQQLKYGGRLPLAEPLGVGLAAAVRSCAAVLPDVLVPLPLAPPRQRQRGFNQSHLVAHVLAQHLHRPLVHGLVRIRYDGPQAAQGQPQRAANMVDAFVGHASLRGRHVAIVDDVLTTGATLAAATLAAQAAGARVVDVHVVARTLPP